MSSSGDAAVDAARRHLDVHTAVAILGLIRLLDEALGRGIVARDDVERRFPFLSGLSDRIDELAGEPGPARVERIHDRAAGIAAEATDPPPLARLASWLGEPGGTLAADLLAAAALVERDARFGAVVETLQASSAGHRPCLGLLALALDEEIDHVAATVARLTDAGLVVVEDPHLPRAEQTLRLPPPVLQVLEGRDPDGFDVVHVADAPAPADLVLPDDVAARVDRAGSLLAGGQLDALVIRGAEGTGRRTVLRVLAGRLGRGLLIADAVDDPSQASMGAAVALLQGALLAATVEPGLGQVTTLPPLPGVDAIAIVTSPRGAVRLPGRPRTAVIDLPTPDADARRRFWSAADFPADEDVLADVSRSFVLTGGTIGRIAPQARALAALEDRDHVVVDDVRRAAQDMGRQQLESLAALLPTLPLRFSPVLGGATADAFETLVLRCSHREVLAAEVSRSGQQINRGVRALLSGPSGTGKTLAARALGAFLGLDVYRADLAALVDKYIGETERRLDELFRRAEELDVVLLIDEGDALMTRRTDVRSSNDRYANLETDYLLQRLETYEGIVLVTTNSPELVDHAFRRRLDVTLTFSTPGPDERLRIWQRHLPERHAISRATLDEVSTSCRLTGGQIRNAAVHAALLALDAGRLMDDTALRAAVEREFTVAGTTSPLPGPGTEATPAPTSAFVRAVASR